MGIARTECKVCKAFERHLNSFVRIDSDLEFFSGFLFLIMIHFVR